MSLKNIAGKVAKKAFHRPDLEWDERLFRDAAGKLQGKLHLWRNKGQNDWDNIKECIRYWAIVEEVKAVFLDNITALTNHLSPSEQNTEIARIATELAGLADELNIRIFVFSHLNPPKGSTSHEEGAEVKEHQFTGSRALQRWCQLILGFERNKQAAGDDKHNSRIRVIKDRNYGNTGIVFTRYNPDTGCLDERFDGSDEEIPQEGEDDETI
jgi:twinkle protein